jgi:hypothetical protein
MWILTPTKIKKGASTLNPLTGGFDENSERTDQNQQRP